MNILFTSLAALSLVALPGCASNRQPATPIQLAERPAYGMVESVEEVIEQGKSGPGAGALIGGVVGGVLGNQMGKGDGNTAMTIAGAVGGAVVGDRIEDKRASRTRYRVSIRMDDGSYKTLIQDKDTFRRGDNVEVRDGRVWRR